MTAETQPAGGYVVVPREPTEAMIVAGTRVCRIASDRLADFRDQAVEVHRAMLSAAPPPQEPEGGALREVIARVGKFAEFWDQSDENHIAEPPEGCEAGIGGLSKDLRAILAALPSLAQPDLQKVQNGALTPNSVADIPSADPVAKAQGERGGEGVEAFKRLVSSMTLNSDTIRFSKRDLAPVIAALSAPPATGWRESFIADEEGGPVSGIVIDLADGSQIWSGECSNALLEAAASLDESPDESGHYLMIVAKGQPTRVVAQVATVDDGIALARAVASCHALPAQQEGGE